MSAMSEERRQGERRKIVPAVPKVPCPQCGGWQSAVKDGRAWPEGYRRKRECKGCQRVFFTVEKVDAA